MIVSLPSLTGAVLMLMMDSVLNTGFFQHEMGGDVLFYQHLFWLFGHPEVYVLIIPGMGVINMAYESLVGGTVVGSVALMAGTLGIGGLGFLVWAHHMYAVGMDVDTAAYFTAVTVLIAVPTGVKVLHYLLSYMTLDLDYTGV